LKVDIEFNVLVDANIASPGCADDRIIPHDIPKDSQHMLVRARYQILGLRKTLWPDVSEILKEMK
jgi:hypothetical protein